MSLVVPVSIPRWQWRTFGSDLSPLFRRFPAPQGAGKPAEEIHLICLHSSHSALLRGNALELRWRKQTAPEGFELWDTILTATTPFTQECVARLWAAWGLPVTPTRGLESVEMFLEQAISRTGSVVPVRLVRRCRTERLNGIGCELETIQLNGEARIESFAIEHEDPSLMTQVLAELGLDPRQNINLVQGIKSVLGLNGN